MKNIIEININDYEDVIEKFDNDKLSYDLASFIYNQSMAMPIKEIEINIKATCELNEKQQEDIVDMIHAYFGLEVKKMLIISKHQNTRQIILFILGIILISVANLGFMKNLNIIRELYLIAGWVAIWEIIYNILFEDIKKRLKLKRYKLLARSRINLNN